MLWEVNETSCFTKNHTFLVIRLTFGIISQIWCSFITFPLYVIMGSRFKKTIVSENIRESLHTWRRRVKAKHKHDPPFTLLPTTSSNMSLDSMVDDDHDEPIARVHTFLDKSKSNADIEVSTHDENIYLDPVRHENEDCDEIYSSSESQRFEPVTETLFGQIIVNLGAILLLPTYASSILVRIDRVLDPSIYRSYASIYLSRVESSPKRIKLKMDIQVHECSDLFGLLE
ncbi:hypothetical protein Hanom_Chr15g01370621 [Helianthus anomalus]